MKRAISFLLTWAMLLAMVPATVLATTGTTTGTAAVRWDVYHEDGADTVKKGWLTFDAAEFENHTVEFYRENGDQDVLLNSETTFCYPGDTAASANLFERDLIDPVVTGDYYAIITDSNGTAVQSPLYHYVRPETSLAVCDLAWDEDKRAATWTDEFADNSVVERYWVQFYCNPDEDNKADAEFVESLDFLPTDEPPCVLPDYILTTGGSGWYYFRVRVWTGDVTKAVTGKMSGLSGGIYLEAPAPSLSVEAPEWGDDMTMTWTDTSLKPEAVDRYWVQFLCNHDTDDPDRAYSVKYRNYYADKAPHVVPEAILEEGGSGWYYFRVQAISYDTTEVPDSLWSELSKGFYYEADTTGGDGELEPAATPTDILWGVRRWQAGDYEEVPGMLSFDAKPGENYLMQFYRQEDSGDQLVFSYTVSCEKEDIYVTQNLFASYTKLDRVTSGSYYCVITPLGDDVNTCKGEPATSGIWEYVRPDNILTVSAPVWGENQAVCWTNEFTDGSALDYYRANFYFNPTEDNADEAECVDFAIYRTGAEPFAAPAELFDENGAGWYYFCMRTRSLDPTKALGTDYTELSAALYYDPDATIGCVHISGEAVVSRVEPTCTESGVETSVVTCTACGEELSRTIVEIPALGHTPGEAVAENRVEPTETANGAYDSVVYCTVCSAQMSRETVVLPATGTPAVDADFPASAEETLTGLEKAVYDALQGCFKQIASGELETPMVKISMESLGLDGTFTAADLGVDALVEGSSITQAAVDALYAKLDFDSELVIYALLADYPFDQFWFDKTKGVTISYPTCSSTGTTIRFVEGGVMTIRMAVCQEYAVMVDDSHYDPYAVDPAALETFGVAAARARARSIVQANADKSDVEKLAAYRDAICEAVTYNSFAAETDGYPYGNPWQLIYVFDDDDNTNVVCEGYAKAFQYLCDLTAFDGDIQCYTVDGVMDGGTGAGDHMWNVVLMPNGERYLVDITNCDEGSVGHPDYLFLAGDDNDGAYDNDCVITILEHALDDNMIALGGTVLYEYHSITNVLWGSELLDIADSDYITGQEPPVHTHTEAVKPGTAATCTKTGLTDGTYCLTCGEQLTAQQVIPALGHAEGETVEVERVEPTCTQNGHSITQRTCTTCGETVYSRVTQLPATGHTPGEAVEENRVDPTEDADGSYDSVVYCTVCQTEVSRDTVVLPAVGTDEPVTGNTPSDLRWGVRIGVNGAYDAPGYMSFRCTGGVSYRVNLYRKAEEGDALVYTKTAKAVLNFYNIVPFNYAPERCITGAYYFTVQELVDGEITDDCPVLTSTVWQYNRPDVFLTAENLRWNTEDGIMEWTVDRSLVSEYDVTILYNANDDDVDDAVGVKSRWYGNDDLPLTIPYDFFAETGSGWYYFAVQPITNDPSVALTSGLVSVSEGLYQDVSTGESTPGCAHIAGEAVEENRVEPTVKTEGSYELAVYCTLCSAELSREKITIPALPEPTFAVSGLVTAHNGSQPGEAIAIALKQGSTTVAETRTNAAGVYLLNGVTAGIYNLVATQADGRSTVLLVEVTEDGLLDTIALPEKNISTQVTVSQDSPAIVVGGLDAEAEASATDDQPLTMSMTLELKSEVTDNTDLSQEEQQLQETQEAIKAQVTEDADRTMLFLEIQVEKAQETISETINLLEIRVPYETRGRQNFQVLRHHEGEVQVLGETPNANGEYIQVFDGYIVIHAKMFSLYAITSLAEGAVHSHNWEQVRYRWTKDGCTALQKCVGCEDELSTPVEIKAKDGKLTLSQVPDGLRILICSYEGERMTGSLLLTQPKAENDLTFTGETLRIFFLNSRHQPLMEPLTVE